jgi:hypothetical protein
MEGLMRRARGTPNCWDVRGVDGKRVTVLKKYGGREGLKRWGLDQGGRIEWEVEEGEREEEEEEEGGGGEEGVVGRT